MKRPEFFIVGHPKSGTTALARYLNQHPEIFISKLKEPQFFSKDFHRESDDFKKNRKNFHYKIRTEEAYLALFEDCEKKISGEASTTYIYSKVAAKEIFDFNPKAKIIMIFREPVDYLYSWHAHSMITAGEHIKSFEQALAAEPERRNGKLLKPMVKLPSLFYYTDRIKYLDQIKRYLKYFSSDQLKIIVYDDFRNDNQKVLNELYQFLNVSQDFKVELKKYNRAKKLKYSGLYFLVRNPRLIGFFTTIFSQKQLRWLKIRFIKFFFDVQKREPLDPSFRDSLKMKYKSEVEKLGSYIDRDLIKEWNYP